MKTFKKLLSEVAQPKAGDEINFKAKHEIELQDYPTDEESIENIFKGGMNGKDMTRDADYLEGEDEEVYESSAVKKGTKVVYGVKINGKLKHKKAKVEDIKNGKIYLDSSAILYDQDQVTQGKIEGHHDFYIEAAFDADLDNNKTIVVQGVKGMKSRPFKKKFRNMAAYEKWIDSDAADDFEVQYVMNEEKTLFRTIVEKYANVSKKTDDGEGMDPVGKADADIDNDGDVDSSDKYLKNRRKAIAKNMKKESRLQEAAKIACLKCDEVSTAAAWKKNGGFCPKCKVSSQGVAESQMDKMKVISKAFTDRKAAERENDALVSAKKASHKSYVEKINGKFFVVDLNEEAKITYVWFDVKSWKDGDSRFDKLDDLLGNYTYKHAVLGNTSRNRPDTHIGIPTAASKAIAFMNKNAKKVSVNEAKMDDAEVLAAAKKLAANGKNAETKKFGKGLVDFYNKNGSFTPDQVSGLQNIMKNASFQLVKEEKTTITYKELIEKYAKPSKKTDDGEGMDPVGHGDADIDNDGDTDSSDEYLRKRRKAIAKTMATSKKNESLDEVAKWSGKVPDCQLCGKKFKERDLMYDSSVDGGSWANMCEKCFKSRGGGLGTGKGQEYKMTRGEWIMTRGGMKEENLDEAKMKNYRVDLGDSVKTVKASSEKDAVAKAVKSLARFAQRDVKNKISMGKIKPKISVVESTNSFITAKRKDGNPEKVMNEAFGAGSMKLNDGSTVKISKQDAELLNSMFKDLNAKNKKEMQKVVMTDKAGFEEILGFAREAI